MIRRFLLPGGCGRSGHTRRGWRCPLSRLLIPNVALSFEAASIKPNKSGDGNRYDPSPARRAVQRRERAGTFSDHVRVSDCRRSSWSAAPIGSTTIVSTSLRRWKATRPRRRQARAPIRMMLAVRALLADRFTLVDAHARRATSISTPSIMARPGGKPGPALEASGGRLRRSD